jgi:hypothetical protein
MDGQVWRAPSLLISVVCGTHLPKIAEGGAASVVVMPSRNNLRVASPQPRLAVITTTSEKVQIIMARIALEGQWAFLQSIKLATE